MKVAINTCYGGFGLSKIAIIMLLRKKGYSDLYFYKMKYDDLYWIYRFERISEKEYLNNKDLYSPMICTKDFGDLISTEDNEIYEEFDESIITIYDLCEKRSDKDLIEVIETIGTTGASSRSANLKIVEIPDDIEYTIDNYDGIESVHEKHRVWR